MFDEMDQLEVGDELEDDQAQINVVRYLNFADKPVF